MDPKEQLKALPKTGDFFIGIDSDGCVFDTMEVKQKECFCPNFIRHFGLQAAGKYGREVWEFVNLYSKTRGCNRFLAICYAIDMLNDRPEIAARGIKLPPMTALRKWVKEESKLGNPALQKKIEETGDEELKLALAWSTDVNTDVKRTVHNVSPFPDFVPAVKEAGKKADIIVVSQTPFEALDREWKENKIDGLVNMICGQELGTKAEHIGFAAGGKYDKDKILMIGDAPGDYKAAKVNEALFYPIIPGREDFSWKRFREEGLSKFFNGTFAGAYQEKILAEFDAALPELPPWKR